MPENTTVPDIKTRSESDLVQELRRLRSVRTSPACEACGHRSLGSQVTFREREVAEELMRRLRAYARDNWAAIPPSAQ